MCHSVLLALLFFALLASSSIGFAADLLSRRPVGPGVYHSEYLLPGPFTLDVLEVDLHNPYVRIETYRPTGLTRTTIQSAANDAAGHRVVGAVNGGFFSFETGWPIGDQLVNGKPVLAESDNRTQIAVTEDGRIYAEQFAFSGSVIGKNGTTFHISNVNGARPSGAMSFFTSFEGASTATDGNGSECVLSIASPAWIANDTMRFVVTQRRVGGASSIPLPGAVLSGAAGSAANFINTNLAVNDTIRVVLGFAPSIPRIRELISGAGRILRNGVNVSTTSATSEGLGMSFVTGRNPRTFVGFNADTSMLYLCTVDGRQASSVGMSFNEMASFLTSIGVVDAVNLDGGGSTTMVVRGTVVNSPSDPGGERSVANSLHVVSVAPTGTLTFLNILEEKADVFQGRTFRFHAEGMDQYYSPMTLPAAVTWEADSNIGTIDSTGVFEARLVNDSGWVCIHDGDVSDSARVFVRMIRKLYVYPNPLIMVPGERLTLSVRGTDSGDNYLQLENNLVTFLNQPAGLNVDASGVATSTGFGSGSFTVKLDTVACVVGYNSSGADTSARVEEFRDLKNWSWDVQNTDPDNLAFSVDSDTSLATAPALKITYDFPLPSATAILNTDLPISSRIDSIGLRVLGNGGGHLLKIVVADKDGQLFSILSRDTVTWTGQWKTARFKVVNAVPVSGGTIDYPLTLQQIQIAIGTLIQSGGRASGTIELDDLSVHYPNRTVTPSVLFDFNAGITGWLQPSQGNAAQLVGINIAASKLEWSAEHPFEGSGCGKWTFVDDSTSADAGKDWSVRIARGTTSELGSMLRGSYIGAWIWANGQTDITLRTVIRDGNGQICQGPAFPVKHIGWKLIGTRLDPGLFTPYLTSGVITDANNRFNGFRVEGPNALLGGTVKVFYIDKMVTSALTVPTGFIDFGLNWDSTSAGVNLHWAVNSEISVNRYVVERSDAGSPFNEIATVLAAGTADSTVQYAAFDDAVDRHTAYSYRVRQITNDGAQELTPVIQFVATGIDGPTAGPVLSYELSQNYPNPFNPTTSIQYAVAKSGTVKMKLYDLLGREVATIVNARFAAGVHTVRVDATHLASGVYLYRMEAGDFVSSRKMLVLK